MHTFDGIKLQILSKLSWCCTIKTMTTQILTKCFCHMTQVKKLMHSLQGLKHENEKARVQICLNIFCSALASYVRCLIVGDKRFGREGRDEEVWLVKQRKWMVWQLVTAWHNHACNNSDTYRVLHSPKW